MPLIGYLVSGTPSNITSQHDNDRVSRYKTEDEQNWRRNIGHEVGYDREQVYQHVGWHVAYQLRQYLPISGYDPYGVISKARDQQGRNGLGR